MPESKEKLERRYQVGELEFKASDNDEEMPKIAGYAALFNEPSEDFGFIETVAPGAFDKSIGGDVRALFNHNPDFVLGRTRSKTLTLRTDNKGLFFEVMPPDTPNARALMTSIQRGDINQMSFGFRTISDDWSMIDGVQHRTLLEVELFDVSPVTFPAYVNTNVALRSLENWQNDHRAVEDYSVERMKLDLLEVS